MNYQLRLFYFLLFAMPATTGFSQDSTKILFNTGVGIVKPNSALRKALRPAVAFNSGFEIVSRKKLFAQLTLDFNSLNYDQQLKVENSPYLFQGTSSSLIMVGINGGKNFHFKNKNWFASVYAGGGYVSIGEPRVEQEGNIITQKIERRNSVFGRTGTRLAYTTKIKLFQTLYVDASWWGADKKVQGAKFSGYSFYIGTQMSMK